MEKNRSASCWVFFTISRGRGQSAFGSVPDEGLREQPSAPSLESSDEVGIGISVGEVVASGTMEHFGSSEGTASLGGVSSGDGDSDDEDSELEVHLDGDLLVLDFRPLEPSEEGDRLRSFVAFWELPSSIGAMGTSHRREVLGEFVEELDIHEPPGNCCTLKGTDGCK